MPYHTILDTPLSHNTLYVSTGAHVALAALGSANVDDFPRPPVLHKDDPRRRPTRKATKPYCTYTQGFEAPIVSPFFRPRDHTTEYRRRDHPLCPRRQWTRIGFYSN